MTTITLNGRTQSPAVGIHEPGILDSLLRTVSEWQRRHRQRRELGEFLSLHPMIDRDLRDLAMSRGDLEFEAHKPFWRA